MIRPPKLPSSLLDTLYFCFSYFVPASAGKMIPHSVNYGCCVLLYKNGIQEVSAVHELIKPTWDIDWPHRAYYATLGMLILEHF